MSSWGDRLAVFDLETTGVDTETARIVSACIAVLDAGGAVVDRWDWLADPGIEIPDGAAAVHGITTERARAEGRSAAEVVAEIAQTLRVMSALSIPIVAYNAPYDLSLLDRECRRYALEPVGEPAFVIDPLVIDRAMDRFRKGKRTLEVTAAFYGVALDDAHDAGSDAIAAGRVALALARTYPEALDITLADLHGRQQVWWRAQEASFADYIRRVKGEDAWTDDPLAAWPQRLAPAFQPDTVPMPALEPRPSTNPVVLQLETEVFEELQRLERPVAPEAVDKPTVLRIVAAIITDADGRTLLVRKRGTHTFMQAGGKIERGETALEALVRELNEELGLVVDPEAVEHLGSFRADAANEENTVVRAEAYALVADREPIAAAEIEELLWLDGALPEGVRFAPLSTQALLPIWESRRTVLF